LGVQTIHDGLCDFPEMSAPSMVENTSASVEDGSNHRGAVNPDRIARRIPSNCLRICSISTESLAMSAGGNAVFTGFASAPGAGA